MTIIGSMMTSAHLAALFLPFVVAIGACDDQGGGAVTAQTLTVAGCGEQGQARTFSPWSLPLNILGAVAEDGVATLRFSPSFRRPGQGDVMVVTIEGLPEVIAAVEAQGRVERPLTEPSAPGAAAAGPDAAIRLGVQLFSGCGSQSAPLVGTDGFIAFERLGVRPGQRVVGDAHFGLVDARTGATAAHDVVATFDFEVRQGPPHTSFAPDEDF